MLSKPLVVTALLFQLAGLIWDFVVHAQVGELSEVFEAPHWPVFLGLVLLLVAVLQSKSQKTPTFQPEQAVNSNQKTQDHAQTEPPEAEPPQPENQD